MSTSTAELRQPVIITYTSGSPSFKSTRRFVYTVCGIHMYTSAHEKNECENHILFPSLAHNAYCELDTISRTSLVLRITKDASSCPIPSVFVVDASALTKGDDGWWQYRYR
jgi:hypothetical protein